jgi:pyruvate,water dikinase
MVSAEPAKFMREMAQIAAADPYLALLLCDGSFHAIRGRMGRCPEFEARYGDYLERFGDRCLEELKLETSTLHDDPLILLRSIGELARRVGSAAASPAFGVGTELRHCAERRVREVLAVRPVRRLVLHWVLQNARARVRDRENLRFVRTRVFGRVRRVFIEIGRRLYALDLLEDPRDIFYLEVDEVLGFVEGTTSCTDLSGLVAVRKAEFAGYREAEPPADLFVSRGIVHQGNPFRRDVDGPAAPVGDQRKGTGCCPGTVQGPVRVVTDPRSAALRAGEILVAERTDPGWVMLFPSAADLLVERGSLLSHAAIVARELGIPAVLAVGGLTHWLKDGDWVELDGSSGIVRRIECPREAVAYAV